MVLGHHLILSTYGFWLPNDPRGSWSECVRKYELYLAAGPATKVETRRSVAGKEHDYQVRQEAKRALDFPPVQFTGEQACSVGNGIRDYVNKSGVTVWACCVLPDHAHLVIARHRLKAEAIINQLKGTATRELVTQKRHPFMEYQNEKGKVPRCWAKGGWKVFLDSVEDIFRCIEYVRMNRVKQGKPEQKWSFVKVFDERLI